MRDLIFLKNWFNLMKKNPNQKKPFNQRPTAPQLFASLERWWGGVMNSHDLNPPRGGVGIGASVLYDLGLGGEGWALRSSYP